MNRNVLAVNSDAELLSYIINVTPELRCEIDLPKQGESILPIGKIIVNNQRYRNAFINTVNLIGLTVIKRNGWDNPWNFTKKGTLRFGQQIREVINDLCNVYDYNEALTDDTRFLQTVVPNVFQYIHELNFQKFYQTTTSDNQLLMAFETGDLFTFIDDAISMLYESLVYDEYIINKYMLCRRILDGTVTSVEIEDFSTKTARQRVSAMKSVANKMTFRSPNYNPAGIRRATSFDNQMFILNTDFEAELSTDVLATSFFRDEADFKSRAVLIDGFGNHDTDRLTEVLGDGYVSFTATELEALSNIPAVIISEDFFMDYDYALDGESGQKNTEFYNPVSMKNNHFLHAWEVFSTSPFANAVVFTAGVEPTVSAVSVSPAESSVSAGLTLQLTATVTAEGFANKAVVWTVEEGERVTVTDTGLVKIPADFPVEEEAEAQVTIRATSVYDSTVYGEATITVL